MFLGEEIQKHGEKGHNPIEDSVAAMKLVNLKLQKGYEFGDVLLGGHVPEHEDLAGNSNRKVDEEDEEGKVLLLSAITEIRDQVRHHVFGLILPYNNFCFMQQSNSEEMLPDILRLSRAISIFGLESCPQKPSPKFH